jgi:hypothetical protein
MYNDNGNALVHFPTAAFYWLLNPLKPKRERERERERERGRSKEKTSGGKRRRFMFEGKKSILLEGTQAMPDRPSDKDRWA